MVVQEASVEIQMTKNTTVKQKTNFCHKVSPHISKGPKLLAPSNCGLHIDVSKVAMLEVIELLRQAEDVAGGVGGCALNCGGIVSSSAQCVGCNAVHGLPCSPQRPVIGLIGVYPRE